MVVFFKGSRWWIIFIEGIDPLSIPPFFRPKFGCWNNSWEFQFFGWKTSIGCLVFVLRKQGLFFVSQWKFPTKKNGTQIHSPKNRWKALSLLCRPIASQPRVSWWSVCGSETFKSPFSTWIERVSVGKKRGNDFLSSMSMWRVFCFFLVVFVACKRFRFLLDHFVSIHGWVGWVMSTFPCHVQEIYLQPSIGLVLHLSILNWKMGRNFQHRIFVQFSWGMICHSQRFVTCSEPCFFWKVWLL